MFFFSNWCKECKFPYIKFLEGGEGRTSEADLFAISPIFTRFLTVCMIYCRVQSCYQGAAKTCAIATRRDGIFFSGSHGP